MFVLNNIYELIDERTEYISFDIYDTLLFRLVRHPERVFEKTYERRPALFPSYIDAKDWREIRTTTERFVREKKKDDEIKFDEIYKNLPEIIKNRDRIKKEELECEKENSFINEEVAEVLYHLVDTYKKKIILVSDMYLPRKAIEDILKYNGFKIQYISDIFISSEIKLTKRTGKLFNYVKEQLSCNYEQIIHIGDNRISDVLQPTMLGIKTVYYPIRSEAFARHPYISYEVQQYGYICDEIHMIRILAAQVFEISDETERFWFEIGAMIIGPLFTYAVEWVLDIAEENKICNIFPMMREGKFLTRLLKNAQKQRQWSGKIVPMYISRNALYPALLSVLKQKDIEYNLSTHKMTVGRLFEIFGLKEEIKYFSEFRDYTLVEAKKIYIGDETLNEKIEKYFYDDRLIQKIRDVNQEMDGPFFRYLQMLKLDQEPYITFDVGWRGNAQNAIQRILNRHGVENKGIHLLINGKKFIMRQHNLEDGCDIRGFTGNFGKNENYINEVIIPIFEMFLMCEEGTTVGYEVHEGESKPIIKKILYDKEQLKMMQFVQNGIISFQEQFFKLRNKKGKLINQRPEELLMLVGRLMNYPTKREALEIGKMKYDQNFGIDETWQIISETKLEKYRDMGYGDFLFNHEDREDEWYQGMDTCLDGLANYKKIMFSKRYIRQYEYCLFVERICKLKGKFILVGAGNHLIDIVAFLEIMGERERIVGVVDSNKYLQHLQVCGYEVFPLEKRMECEQYVITAVSKKTIRELIFKLTELFGTNIIINHMYGGGNYKRGILNSEIYI